MLNAWVCPRVPAGNIDAARLAYAAGIKRCMDAIPLWVAAARLEERAGNVAKARALLEQVRRSALPAQHAAAHPASPGLATCPAPAAGPHHRSWTPPPTPPSPPQNKITKKNQRPTTCDLTTPNFCLFIQIHVRLYHAALLPCRRG